MQCSNVKQCGRVVEGPARAEAEKYSLLWGLKQARVRIENGVVSFQTADASSAVQMMMLCCLASARAISMRNLMEKKTSLRGRENAV